MRDFLIFSNIARLTYVIIVCIIVGFVVPLILNETGVFDYAPPNNDVPATCRILEGVRWVKREIRNATYTKLELPIFRTDCMPGEDMSAVTYERCTELGCCFNQIRADIGFCHHKIPSMHTFNVTAGSF